MRFVAALSILCALPIGTSHAADPDAKALSRGKGFFRGLGCVRCHRVGEEGGKLGPDLSFVGFRKSPEWIELWLKDPPAWKKDTIMPKFKLTEPIRRDLVAYLSSLTGEPFARDEFPPWNKRSLLADPVKRGEVLFSRVGCRGCHGIHGRGGYPNNNVAGGMIPALTNVADGYSMEELQAKIRLGSKPAKADPGGPDPMVAMPPWGKTLQDNEIEALSAYLISLRPKTSPKDW